MFVSIPPWTRVDWNVLCVSAKAAQYFLFLLPAHSSYTLRFLLTPSFGSSSLPMITFLPAWLLVTCMFAFLFLPPLPRCAFFVLPTSSSLCRLCPSLLDHSVPSLHFLALATLTCLAMPFLFCFSIFLLLSAFSGLLPFALYSLLRSSPCNLCPIWLASLKRSYPCSFQPSYSSLSNIPTFAFPTHLILSLHLVRPLFSIFCPIRTCSKLLKNVFR